MTLTAFATPARRFTLACLLVALAAAAASAANAGARSTTRSASPRPAITDTTGDGFFYIGEVLVGVPTCEGCPPRACPDESTRVTIRGVFPNLCYVLTGLHELPVAAPFTVIVAEILSGSDCSGGCPDAAKQFSGSMMLTPPLTPGPHSFLLVERERSCRDTAIILSSRQQMITYEVLPRCGPVPIDSLAKTLVGLGVAPEPRCAADSLSLLLFKNGCRPCTDLTGLTLEPGVGFHATLDWRPNCLELACFPETLSTPLGRLPAGHHTLTGRVDVHLLLEPAADSTISYYTRVEFDVPQTCDTTEAPCMSPFLVAGAVRSVGCALTVDAGASGELTLSAYPTEPLGGLQGRIDCSPPFRIVRAGAPEGMSHLHVSWAAEGRGIRYLIFADAGFPIDFPKGPVLRLQIAADHGAPPGARGSLFPLITLAADTHGDSVRLCDPRLIDPAPIELCVSGDPGRCDANGDGHGDVRDLVLMAGCFRHLLSPEDSTRICRDCDGDSLFSIADLFCCARQILRGPLVPRDSVHTATQLRVSFDPPWATGNSLMVGVRISGAEALSAALLQLKYPGERWRAEAVLLAPGRQDLGGWMPIVDTDEPGRIYLGGLRLGDVASDEIRFTLALTPIAPPLPGDRIEAEGADLATPDGTVLTPPGALPTLTLDAPPASANVIALSPARPNPFGSLTSFVVSLPKPAQVDLAIHDLAGRRITTLAHGALGAGERTFSWDGAGARDGLYFVRLTVDGQVLSTRVALLKESR